MILARRFLLLLTAIAAVAGLSACGSGSGSVGSAQDVLKETFGPNKPVKSGKLNLTLQFNSKGLKGIDAPISATLSGPFQSNGGKIFPSFDFGLDLNAGGAAFTAGATSTGTNGFLKLEGTTYKLSDSFFKTFTKGYATATKSDTKKASQGPSLQTLGIDPRHWLSAPKKIGTEDVGGTKTTHVTATVDVRKLLGDVDTLLRKAGSLAPAASTVGVPDGLTASQRNMITNAVKSATFDVWSGVSDGTLRRLLVKVGFAVPKTAQSSVGGLQQGNLTIDLTLSDLNKPQTIKTPVGAHPMSELTSQIAGLLGLTGKATGSLKSSSSSSGTAAPSSAYLDCLGKAGADIQKVQACAQHLGK